jgi:hypothetical protein
MANRTTRTDRKVRKFLSVLADTANVHAACREAGIPRQNVYEWRKQDPEFAQQMDKAVELGTAALEDEAVRRAMEGWDEPVFYKGTEVGSIRRFSDQLLITLLKARRPDKYREGIEDGSRGSFVLNVNVVQVENTQPVILEVGAEVVGNSDQQDSSSLSETTPVS